MYSEQDLIEIARNVNSYKEFVAYVKKRHIPTGAANLKHLYEEATMRYSELSETAKVRAAQSYIDGYNETHDDYLSLEDAKLCCEDTNDDVEYDSEGNLIS